MEQYDDSRYPWEKHYNLLPESDMDERVYPDFKYELYEDQHVDPVDVFIDKMITENTRWKDNVWVVEDEEMFADIDLYPVPLEFMGSVYIDEDRMGEEVNTFLRNLGK